MKKRGSTLLEVLMYISLFSGIVCLFVPWIVQTHIHWIHLQQRTHHALDCACALDAWVHDMRSAPSHEDGWKQCTDNELIWRAGDEDIGWCIDEHKMIRSQGTYDVTNKQWTKKQSSCSAHNIDTFHLTTHRSKGHILAVACDLVDMQGKHYTRTVCLNNRVLV